MSPLPSPAGAAWHSQKGWVLGQSQAGLWGGWPRCPCLRQEPPALPTSLGMASASQGWWQRGAGRQALPSPASCPL